MNHYTTPQFWALYEKLPEHIQRLADRNYQVLKTDPLYPSLHFRKINEFWSVRIGLHYRALGVDTENGILWFWIGSHAEYDHLVA